MVTTGHGSRCEDLKTFLQICAQKCDDFSIGMTRYEALDNFSFDLRTFAEKMKEL